MMALNRLASLSAILGGCLALIAGGCGLLTAPASVPMAVAENGNFSLNGPLVDLDGRPLDGVLVSQQLQHHFWTPVVGGTDTDEHRLLQFSRTYSINERGRDLHLTFSKDGFYNTDLSFADGDPDTIHADCGDWPNAKNFPVVLFPKDSIGTADSLLNGWRGGLDYSDYPRQTFIDVAHLIGRAADRPGRNAEDLSAEPPGMFYLTLVKQEPKPLNAKGDIDPLEVNLPGRIALHITGPNAGFCRIEPRLGYGPMQTSDLAPETGYAPELVIERARLKEMRMAAPQRILEAHEYFYFHINNYYGKGFIRWVSVNKDSPAPAAFHFVLFSESAENDRRLRTHDAQIY